MLEHIDIPRQELYDGLEDGLWDQTFVLPVHDISFSVGDLRGNSFDALQAQLGDGAFEQLIADAGIRRCKGTYTGVHDLSLDFLVRGGHLFVLAVGELSPGRYHLALQGAWRIS